MNSLNRSRSRSPSQVSYGDYRRSVSPNFPRKSLQLPASINRSRSPTPNFTSTHLTKLSTNRSPQHTLQKPYGHQNVTFNNSGHQSLPVIPTSPKSKHVSSMQIPVDTKVRDRSLTTSSIVVPIHYPVTYTVNALADSIAMPIAFLIYVSCCSTEALIISFPCPPI